MVWLNLALRSKKELCSLVGSWWFCRYGVEMKMREGSSRAAPVLVVVAAVEKSLAGFVIEVTWSPR